MVRVRRPAAEVQPQLDRPGDLHSDMAANGAMSLDAPWAWQTAIAGCH